MKKKTKILLGGITLLLGSVILSGCTASFCSPTDKAHMLYAFDYGVTNYRSQAGDTQAVAYIDGTQITLTNIKYQSYSSDELLLREEIYEYCKTYKNIDTNATKNGIRLPSVKFLTTFDAVVLGHAITAAYADTDFANEVGLPNDKTKLTADQIVRDWKSTDKNLKKGILDKYGYLKYADSVNDKKVLWTNYDVYYSEVVDIIGVDECPSSDYIKLYKSAMNSSINAYRSCLATESGDYGAYGPRGVSIEVEGKKWTDWKGLLEFILIWPIGALIDVLTKGFLGAGIASGWAQALSILIVTVIIRGLMLLFTIKQSSSTAKMNELQPEIQKIQAKYPNANTDQNQKQRMAQEMQKLYKKHNINPLSSLLTMFIQFPVFICVWGAMQGSSYLSSGTLLGLRLSDSISSVLFNAANWSNGSAITALILFLLMSAAQVVAMLLPQWIQKARAKQVAKLGKNPAQASQNNRMKWFTYIMMGMIIFMGFSLASGMGIYWLFGALFSVAQTLIMQAVNDRKSRKTKYGTGRKGENVTGRKK